MYKINHKAVLLVFILQLLVGGVWYSAAPTTLLDMPIGERSLPDISRMVVFILSILVYLYFTAWLLVRIKWTSSFDMMILVVGIWLCSVLPNFIFVSLYFNLEEKSTLYLLAYGAINCTIAAIILPLWRSSRSIFKG